MLHLFHSIHAIQEFVCDRVQLQQIHTVEGSLQQLKDGRQLKRSNGFHYKNSSCASNIFQTHKRNLQIWRLTWYYVSLFFSFFFFPSSFFFYAGVHLLGALQYYSREDQRAMARGGVGGQRFTFTFSFPASMSFFSLNSPSQGLTADGGAMQAHLQ